MAAKKPQAARKTPERPIVVPTFGACLRVLRGKVSRGKICDQLAPYGLSLDRSTLLQYERGTVASPDPAILAGLSRIYHVPLDEIVLPLLRDRTRHPERFSTTVQPTLNAEQRRIAEWFGRLLPEAQEAIHTILQALAPRHLDLEDDRRHA